MAGNRCGLMKIVADLHMHSTCSDGKFAPIIILEKVIKAGLSTFALSDHDTIDHIPIITDCIKKERIDIQFIPATELSCEYNGESIHILAYLQKDNIGCLTEIFIKMKAERKSVIRKMGLKLKKLGYNIDVDSIIKNVMNPGRPHLGNELIKKGYFKDLDEVFNKVLGLNKPAYIKKNVPSAKLVIKRIRELGGISILAHPGVYENFSKTKLINLLDLDGIEVFHPAHSKKQTQYYLEFTQKHNLLVTGGSDYHGWDDKSSIGSFGINGNYLNNFNKLLN